MKKYLALALGIVGLGGCSQVNRAGELFLAPPLDILESLKAVCLWLGSLLGDFILSLVGSIF